MRQVAFFFVTESRFLFGVSSRMTLWEQISINLAILINLLVAFFYPFSDGPGGECHAVVLLSFMFPDRYSALCYFKISWHNFLFVSWVARTRGESREWLRAPENVRKWICRERNTSHCFLKELFDESRVKVFLLLFSFFPSFVELDGRLSVLVWLAMIVSFVIIVTFPRPSGIRTFVGSTILRLIFSVGLEPTLKILGLATVSNNDKRKTTHK